MKTETSTQHITALTEQPVSIAAHRSVAAEEDLTTDFFIVGGVINIVMIIAYFVWAFKAWKKLDKKKQS